MSDDRAKAIETTTLGGDLPRLVDVVKAGGPVTNEELIAAFAEHQRRRNLSKETTKRETVIVRALARHRGGGPLLEAVTAEIEAFLDAKPRAMRTRSSYCSYLASFWTWANREGLTDRDPTTAIVRPKLPRLLPRPVPDADLQLAVQTAHQQGDRRMVLWLLLGAFQGLRVQEIAGLAGEDVLLGADPPMLRVCRAKGGKERMVPLNPYTGRALQAYGLPRHGPLFPGACEHQPIRPGTITKYVTRHLRGLGMHDTAHALRHWFGTEAYRTSKDLRLVQELLGHASPSTTQGYAAVSPGAAVGIVQALGDRLRQAGGAHAADAATVVVWLALLVLSHPLPGTPW